MRLASRILLLAISAASACHGVDRLFEGPVPPDARLAMALESTALTVYQGGEQSFTASVTRIGDFSGQVVLTVEDLPPGVTATVGQTSTVGQVTSATVTVRAAPTVALGPYQITVRGHANQLPDATARLGIFVAEPPAFTLALSRSAVTTIRGGIAPLTVTFARTNLASPISLSLAGPAGISAAFTPNPAAADTAAATLSVGSEVSPGTYTVTIRASATGVVDRSATLTVSVLADRTQLIVGPEVTVAQGSSGDTKIIINRSNYPGEIALSAENLPAGVTASFQPNGTTGTASTLTLAAAPTVPAGVYPISLRAQGAGVPDAIAEVRLTVNPVSLTLSFDPTSVSVFQGGSSARSALTIKRTGFSGAVSLSIEGAPAGVTVVAESTTVAGASTAINVVAAAAAVPAQYTVTIRATPSGFPSSASRTAPLIVNVRAAPTSGNVLLDWSTCTVPDWIGYQDGNGPWTQAVPTAGVARFTVSSGKGGFAYVELRSKMTVTYMTQDELTAGPINMCPAQQPAKIVSGTAIHTSAGPTDGATYSLGGGLGTSSGASPNFVIQGVRDGVHDLVGWAPSTLSGPRGMLIRDVDLPDGGSLGTVSWQVPGAFNPVRSTISVNGFSGDVSFAHAMSYLTTAACTVNPLYSGASTTMFGVPQALQRPNDFHMVTLLAATAANSRTRTVSLSFQVMTDRTIALPPVVNAPLLTTLSGSYKRLQANVGDIPGVYNRSAVLEYGDGGKQVVVSASTGYAGTVGVVLATPDLSGVSGWDSAWAMSTGATGSWFLTLGGATGGSICAEGERTVSIRHRGSF
jgi:hypothetical protein